MKPLTGKRIQPAHCETITTNIIACLSGVGRERTRLAAQLLISQKVELLISWGSAAGLSPKIASGDLLIPESVKVNEKLYSTYSPFNDELLKQIPGGVPVHRGPICGTGILLVSVESKKKLFENSQCLAADMESASLAELATAKNIPFSVIRTVSDPANMKLPKAVLAGLGSDGQFQVGNFLKTALMFPMEWWSIIKLVLNFKKAQKTLNIVAQLLKAKF